MDSVWRLAARQEAGGADGDVAVTVTEDVQAFFETLDRDRLINEAKALGFPLPIMRAALAAYSSARMISMCGRVSREVYPTTGIIAGCSLAMTLTKVYSVRALDELAMEMPAEVRLDTYVDDLILSAVGAPAAIIEYMVRAHALLRDTVTSALGCSLAPGKASVTATSRSIAAAVARGIGLPASTSRVTTVLGIDNAAAAPRAALRGRAKKARRLRAAMARRKRLRNVQRAVGAKAVKVFVAGIQPAATYGAQVWGMDDSEIMRLRKLAAAALRPQGNCRSLRMTHLWHGLPTATAENAPLLQLARATWNAVTHRDDAIARGASVADIRGWWETASAQFSPLAQDLRERIKEAHDAGGEVPRAVTRRLWKRVRGPFGAAALTAARLGWELVAPLTIRLHNGAEVLLTNTPPALIKKHAEDAMRIGLEKAIARQRAEDEPRFHARRACIDLVTSAVKNDRGLSPHQRGIMRGVVCGALMTGSRALRMGYQTCGLCPLCGEALDTLTHRVYQCVHTSAAVKAAVPRWFWEEAVGAAPGNGFWTTGVCPHPADLAPPPCLDLNIVVDANAGALLGDDDADMVAVGGRIYVDGSCTTPAVRSLARAACAVVQTDEEGRPTKTLQIAVPRHLPQTAQAAEFLGLGIAIRALRRGAIIIGDCLNVVNAANGVGRNAMAPTRMYAGILMEMLADPDKRRMAGTILWTKAHRDARDDDPPEVRRDIAGNAAADKAAKEAIGGHPQIGPDAQAQLAFCEGRVQHVVRAVIAALELFPRAPGNMARAPRPATEAQARQSRRHLWTYRGGAWRCDLCNDWLNADRLPRARLHQRCTGKTLGDEAAAMARRGHELFRAEAQVPFVYCRRCGAWGHRRTRLLATGCCPPRPSGTQALQRIRAGVHPLQRRGPGGVLMPREKIRTVAAYSAEEARWRQWRFGSPSGVRGGAGHGPCDSGVALVNGDAAASGPRAEMELMDDDAALMDAIPPVLVRRA